MVATGTSPLLSPSVYLRREFNPSLPDYKIDAILTGAAVEDCHHCIFFIKIFSTIDRTDHGSNFTSYGLQASRIGKYFFS
ncbi:hypothetical protein L1987_01337 [Smallanthus sonchifolius]|uniref:Uncharacterized protein n=1 Tax=Smallanthus sonchifolius TaxID=185202 RepID=A0ACB9K4N5_9ASTR|nr:hypothetical protein L1987_01337 [Smallanthus sonchifolius]